MVFSICKCKFMVFGFHHYARSLKFINIFTIIICILAGIYYIYFDYEEMVRHVMTLMINIETCVAMAFTLIASNCSQILYDKYSS